MSQLEDDLLREEQLYKIIFQSGITCHFCKSTEDRLHCDILFDQSECKKHLCVRCYNKYGQEHCQAGHKYEDHYFNKPLVRLSNKIGLFDQANKTYQREHKIRNNPLYQELELDLINIMTYLYMNPAPPQQRVSFASFQSTVKQSLSDKKNQEKKLDTHGSKTKKASFISRQDHRHLQSGIQTCGYKRLYDKGIILTLRTYTEETIPSTASIENSNILKQYFQK